MLPLLTLLVMQVQIAGLTARSEGNVQPVAQNWTHQGMGNNMVQRVRVLVE